jgi:DNA-binding CsgD family transcriptional regulator
MRRNAKLTPTRARIMAALYDGGSTLQEIGDEYGITRERVRQIIRSVQPEVSAFSRVSPTDVMRAIRRPGIVSKEQAARVAGVTVKAFAAVTNALGVCEAAHRLFRARREHACRARMIGRLREHVDDQGHPRPAKNSALTRHAISLFGSIRAAREAAGFSGEYLDQSWNKGSRGPRSRK